MYFLRIKRLKNSLIENPLSEKTAFYYFLLYVFLNSLLISIDIEDKNIWDIFDSFFMVIGTVLGTIFLFLKNNGAKGSYFLQRYFSIGWVISIRFTLMCYIPFIIVLISFRSLYGDISEGSTWYQSILFVAIYILYYWRFGIHISQVAQNAIPIPNDNKLN